MENERIIRMVWSRPQSRALATTTRYVDLEGAIRSGKTTVGIWKAINLCQNHPGIHGLLSRWTGDALDAQLKPRFWELCPPELLDTNPWNGKEHYVRFANGSWLYIRALRSGEDDSRYAKVSGLTLAFIIVDQAEEVPEDVYHYLQGRISQPGMPQQIILMPNPPAPDHWLAREFPEDGQKENREYIQLSTYDNREHLGEDYIRSLEEAYPLGHPMRERLLLGRRGVTTVGVPVYGKIFKPDLHVRVVEPRPNLPLLEAWDFGFHHPAVSWHQWTRDGRWLILDELMGDRQYLEDFIPLALQRRGKLLVPGQPVWTTADPSGATTTSHGSQRTAVQVLAERGIHAQVRTNANRAEVRGYAIEQIARLLLRLTPEGPAFVAHPRCATIVAGMTSGYVYPEKMNRAVMVPLKDGFYDHLMNTLEYAVLAFLLGEGQEFAMVDEDPDEDEWELRKTDRRMAGRAGY